MALDDHGNKNMSDIALVKVKFKINKPGYKAFSERENIIKPATFDWYIGLKSQAEQQQTINLELDFLHVLLLRSIMYVVDKP